MTLQSGSKSPEVKALQEAILKLNPRALPRWGADGVLGDETLHAVAVLLNDEQVIEDDALSDAELDRIYQLLTPPALPAPPPGYVDLRLKAAKEERRSKRPISKVTALVWHQTDVDAAHEEVRYLGTPVHYVIPRDGRILHLHDEEWLTWGGHSTNSFGVHIEIEGRLLGVEGDPKTYRKYHVDAGRPAQTLTPEQIASGIALGRYIQAKLLALGGKLLWSVAHRQGTNVRTPDPGSAVWKEIVLLLEQIGILAPWDKVWGKGQQIPTAWDPRSTAKY
jgi:hypothetical protein